MKRAPMLLVVGIVVALSWMGWASSTRDASVGEGMSAWRDGRCGSCHRLNVTGNGPGLSPALNPGVALGGQLGSELTGVVTRRGRAWVEHVLVHGTAGMPPSTLDPVRHPSLLRLLEHGVPGSAGP